MWERGLERGGMWATRANQGPRCVDDACKSHPRARNERRIFYHLSLSILPMSPTIGGHILSLAWLLPNFRQPHTHTCMTKFKFLLLAITGCSGVKIGCCHLLSRAPIILFKVTAICAATTLSRVHPSLDVLIKSILIHTDSLIKPLLIKKKLLNQGGI